MVYVTHNAAIRTMLSNPKPFIDQLLAKAVAVGIDGFDVDYEPQSAAAAEEDGEGAGEQQQLLRAEFMGFLGQHYVLFSGRLIMRNCRVAPDFCILNEKVLTTKANNNDRSAGRCSATAWPDADD